MKRSSRCAMLIGNAAAGRCPVRAIFAGITFMAALTSASADAIPIPVRFPEGITHGYLVVRSPAGEIIGRGELTQVVKGSERVESRLIFRFKDGSLHDEQVAFSQRQVFTLVNYRLIQRGPAFPEQLEVSVDRGTGKYEVRSREGMKENEEVRTGRFDLPMDVYNGMLITVLLNLRKGADTSVNVLSFTPEPDIVTLQLLDKGEHAVHIGDTSAKARHYVFEPQIGTIKKFLGRISGKLPSRFHYDCWITADDVPGFVQFEGPLQLRGPIMRIELISPRLANKPD
ncbi:MAG TPA: hypothetical protein VIU63_05740 [Nitrospira sp.]